MEATFVKPTISACSFSSLTGSSCSLKVGEVTGVSGGVSGIWIGAENDSEISSGIK